MRRSERRLSDTLPKFEDSPCREMEIRGLLMDMIWVGEIANVNEVEMRYMKFQPLEAGILTISFSMEG